MEASVYIYTPIYAGCLMVATNKYSLDGKKNVEDDQEPMKIMVDTLTKTT